MWSIRSTLGIILDSSWRHQTSHERDGADGLKDIKLSILGFDSAIELTIASGEITTTGSHHSVDTESDTANDDLDTINGLNGGDMLLLLPASDARTVRLRNGVGNIYLKHQVQDKSYNFNSPAGSSGTFYVAGFYDWSATDANLNETTPTNVAHGGANVSKAAHAAVVAGGAGSVTGGGVVSIVVSGTSIDDEGNRSAADSETVAPDITAMSTDEFFTTVKKWLGTVTWTITVVSGTPSAYNADFNFGLCKYEDFNNQDFTVTSLECVGLAGASDTGFNIRLRHHSGTGWTYAASGFVPGGTILANMNTDHSTEQDLASGEPFAYKRTDLNTDISGTTVEGVVVEIITGANRAVESMDVHIGVHTAPNFSYMATNKQHLVFMKHGPNWLEL